MHNNDKSILQNIEYRNITSDELIFDYLRTIVQELYYVIKLIIKQIKDKYLISVNTCMEPLDKLYEQHGRTVNPDFRIQIICSYYG